MTRMMLLATVFGAAIGIPALAEGAHEMHEHMSGSMTRSSVETMVKEHFAKVDTNGDGYIDKAEADAAREKMMADMRDRHFKMMDTNGDGSISRAEFDAESKMMAMHGDMPAPPPAPNAPNAPPAPPPPMMMHGGGMAMMGGHDDMMRMRHGGDMFERADANKDGRVSLAEALAKPLAHFDKVDTNKDGKISPEERKAAHEKMRAEWHSKHG
ncbi:EF-hand domain-containing protein [Aquisediminimonas profunda]|uniref:EF-hand domain-containing protein n=1 Tax=Aquisediminimonas profunda TaxID=1550733 RepID=UPI001C63192D|nr:EF-hand domain-containing protein [Aquisediminimonas profunda]